MTYHVLTHFIAFYGVLLCFITFYCVLQRFIVFFRFLFCVLEFLWRSQWIISCIWNYKTLEKRGDKKFMLKFKLFSNLLFLLEPGLRGQARAAGEFESPVQDGGHDGPGQADHHPGQARLMRVPREHNAGQEVLHALQIMRRAADQAGPLRLRAEEHLVRVEDARCGKEGPPQGLGEHDCYAGAEGHELVKTCRWVAW